MVFIFFERSFNLCIKQFHKILYNCMELFKTLCNTLNFVKCYLIIQNLVNDEKIKKYFLNENQIFYWILKNIKILIYIYILIK